MISRLLGHARFSTTMIYLHVRILHLGSAPSPIDWLPGLLLPGITYFQVVFTIPDKLSSLALGNRSVIYDLLFRAAWKNSSQNFETTFWRACDVFMRAADSTSTATGNFCRTKPRSTTG